MRCGASWGDACILNYSSRGMLVHAPQAPSRGSYLEIRRGCHVIVARVIWTNSNRFGVQTQDPVPAAGLISEPYSNVAAARPGTNGVVERRTETRQTSCSHEASRWRARMLEVGALAILGALMASLAIGAVHELLAGPVAAVETVLND